jgi:hypothetical protein
VLLLVLKVGETSSSEEDEDSLSSLKTFFFLIFFVGISLPYGFSKVLVLFNSGLGGLYLLK